MNNSDMMRNSNCLDQILLVIFIVLIIAVIIFFFNTNDCHSEKFKEKINYLELNNNNMLDNKDIDNFLDKTESENNYYNNLNKKIYKDILTEKNNELLSENETLNNDTEINKFLRRINDKYNNVKMEYNIEPFESLNDDNTNKQFMSLSNYNLNEQFKSLNDYNMNEQFKSLIDDEQSKMNNINKLSQPENLSGFINGDQSCNMNEQQKELVDDYKKKYFKMYRHQIECPKDCHLHSLNLKKCNLSDNNDCQGIFTNDYNNPDVFTLSNLALDKNNRRECVTCTANDSRQTKNMPNQNDDVNEEDQVKINERRLNNRNKFADFNDYIDRNGVMETSVDKIAELRTCNNGTCGLNSYGKKVSDVYNNLLSTTYTEEKNKCVNGPVEGINDSNFNDSYASPI
jgi:hypothetical protein